jgi:hypothetical protein
LNGGLLAAKHDNEDDDANDDWDDHGMHAGKTTMGLLLLPGLQLFAKPAPLTWEVCIVELYVRTCYVACCCALVH